MRADILHFLADPSLGRAQDAYEYIADGILLTEDGHIKAVGTAKALLARLPKNVRVIDRRGCLIMPGMVDLHTHFPQIGIVASYGRRLVEWLDGYAFPQEQRFADKAYARRCADFFLHEMLRNGTTTAMVFATVHSESVDAIFEAAHRLDLRLIAGKVLMDRNAPKGLLESAKSAYLNSRKAIERWHGSGRLAYAVTPRFAPTSTPELLKTAGRLLREHPGVYLQTHLCENREEIAWVKKLFPRSPDYLGVYEEHGLAGERSVFAHYVHQSPAQTRRLARRGCAVAFCPSSNLFLGSGLFDHAKVRAEGISVGLGSDIGAGTSLSLLRNLSEAYKVGQLRGYVMDPFEAFYMVTLGGAKALRLDGHIGNLVAGKEADLIVVDLHATELMSYRMKSAGSLRDRLFLLMMLGDERCIRETYVMGKRV